jgi:hypothetical protein
MGASLGPSIYKMIVDTTQFVEGVALTRRELSLQKRILEETRPVAEKYGSAMQVLEEQFRKGAFGPAAFKEAARQLRADLPENIAAQESYNQAIAAGESTRQAMISDEQRLAEATTQHKEALRGVAQLQEARVISDQKAHEMLGQLYALSPTALQAEKDRAEAMKHGQEIIRGLMTDEQRLEEVQKRAAASLAAGGITQAQYDQHIENHRRLLPSVAAEEQKRAAAEQQVAAMIERNLTDHERYHAALTKLNALEGTAGMTEQLRARELKRLASQLPENIEAERRHAEAIERGRALNEQYMPTTVRARRDMMELHSQFVAGRVSADSYANGMIQLTATQLTGVPVIGRFASMLANVNPIALAATVAIGTVTAGVALLSRALSFASEKVREQIASMDKLIEESQTIGVAAGEFQRMAHMADLANMSHGQLASGMENMLVNTSKAADGNAKLGRSFELAGLNAQQLRNQRPELAFIQVLNALQRIPNEADRVRAATAIFGSADFLRINTADIERTLQLFQELRAEDVLGPKNVAQFQNMDAAVKDMNLAWDVTWQKVANAVTPAIQGAAEATTEWLVRVNQSQQFQNTLQAITVSLEGIVAVASEVPGVLEKWESPIRGATTGLMSYYATLTGTSGAFGNLISSTQDIGEVMARAHELDAQRAALELKRRSRATTGKDDSSEETVASIEHESKAIEELNRKLKEEVATQGMSTAAAHVWRLEQLGASEAVLVEARKLAAEYDDTKAQKKAKEAVDDFTMSLRHQSETAKEASRRHADEKLAAAGVAEPLRQQLMAQYDVSVAAKEAEEADKKLKEEQKRLATEVQNVADELNKKQAALVAYNNTIGTVEQRTRAAERAEVEYELTQAKASDTLRDQKLAQFDQITALERRERAVKMLAQAMAEAEKEVRQSRMTESEKIIDNLKQTGAVTDEELEKLRVLLKQKTALDEINNLHRQALSITTAGSKEQFERAVRLERERDLTNSIRRRNEPAYTYQSKFPAAGRNDFEISGASTTTVGFDDPFTRAFELNRIARERDRIQPIASPQVPIVSPIEGKKIDKTNELLTDIRNKDPIQIIVEEVSIT